MIKLAKLHKEEKHEKKASFGRGFSKAAQTSCPPSVNKGKEAVRKVLRKVMR